MTSLRILAPALLTFAIVSCANNRPDTYDTPTADGSQVNAPVNPPSNPVYDTPAAYEETSATTPNVNVPAVPAYDPTPSATVPTAPTAPSNGAAIIHTVVAGDTLSGISAKYKVPSAAIKQANRMTTDVVVLGKKMVIPPVR